MKTGQLILEGKQALILGYGVIGRRLAQSCLSLGMTVKAVKREGGKESGREEGPNDNNNNNSNNNNNNNKKKTGGWLTRVLWSLAKKEGGREGGVKGVEIISLASLHEELPRTTALLLALPGTAATMGMIGQKEISLLPPSAVVVNVGRGGVVEEEALYLALKERRIWAAGLDVWWQVRGREGGREGMGV